MRGWLVFIYRAIVITLGKLNAIGGGCRFWTYIYICTCSRNVILIFVVEENIWWPTWINYLTGLALNNLVNFADLNMHEVRNEKLLICDGWFQIIKWFWIINDSNKNLYIFFQDMAVKDMERDTVADMAVDMVVERGTVVDMEDSLEDTVEAWEVDITVEWVDLMED